MIVFALAYSHTDTLAAERLLWWMQFLDSKQGGYFKRVGCVLCASQLATQSRRHPIIVSAAKGLFGKVYVHVPQIAERGYPMASNQMFASVLNLLGDQAEVFFMEPDAIPITPDWFVKIHEEYANALASGKVFMGAYVGPNQTSKPHMSGIGVYGRDWKRLAPKLGEPTNESWDTYATAQVLPHAHFTPLIQHVFRRQEFQLDKLNPGAVLYHRDKEGRFISLLNVLRYSGEFRADITALPTMTKYYYGLNTNRRIKAAGFEFEFESIEPFAGVWYGVYKTDLEQEQAALSVLTTNPQTGIAEIDEAAYETEVKKKSPSAKGLRIPEAHMPLAKPTPIAATVAAVAGVVVDNQPVVDPIDARIEDLPATVEEVLKIGEVSLPPPPLNEKKARPRKGAAK